MAWSDPRQTPAAAAHPGPAAPAILPGITRDSLLILARRLHFTVVERRMELEPLLEQIERGECSELFACGTAAIVSPIAALADTDGPSRAAREYAPRRVDVVAAQLRDSLLAIHERRAADPFEWTRR